MNEKISKLLFYFKFSEPTLVESEADIDTIHVFFDKPFRILINPFAADIQNASIVISINNRDSKANTCRYFTWSILTIYL